MSTTGLPRFYPHSESLAVETSNMAMVVSPLADVTEGLSILYTVVPRYNAVQLSIHSILPIFFYSALYSVSSKAKREKC